MACKKNLLKSAYVLALIFSYGLFAPSLSGAQDKALVDIISAATAQPSADAQPKGEDTHPPLNVTPDKSEIIKLDADAASVIVGNPDHISVLAESERLLVVVPKAVGATYFTVLDSDGAVLMQRHVIVGSPKDNYVRVKKTCQSTGDANKAQGGCKPTNVYYCPDMCHNIGAQAEGMAQDSSSENSKDEETSKEDEEQKSSPVYESPSEGGTEE